MDRKVEAAESTELDDGQEARWAQVVAEVELTWSDVFSTVDRILKVHLRFGFEKFAENLHPSIDDVVLSLKIAESLLDTLYNSAKLDYSEQRLIFNCKQQILLVQELAEAVRNRDQSGYEQAIGRLRNQAPF